MSLLRIVLLSLALLPSLAKAGVYCCTDASGHRVCGDPLPQACFNRGYQELKRSGRIKEVEAPLTPEQRVKREAELKAQRDKAAAEATARRRDQVLIESYATISDLEKRRDRELSIVESELKIARSRETLLLAQQTKLEKQKASTGKNTPVKLLNELETNASELNNIRLIISSKQKEFDAQKVRFENDIKRYLELTGPSKH